MSVPADTLTAHAGNDIDRVSFIKLDVEGAETALGPQLAADFPHPGLVVALEARAPIGEVLEPFRKGGFHVYDLHNDYNWQYERKVPVITPAEYSDFTSAGQADGCLAGSRSPISEI